MEVTNLTTPPNSPTSSVIAENTIVGLTLALDAVDPVQTLPFIGFFCAVRHTAENLAFLVKNLLDFEIGNYLVIKEVSPTAHVAVQGEHVHFLVQMSKTQYHTYAKRVFLDHFKLSGRASAGKPRSYGKISLVKDADRLAVYMMKDDDDGTNVVATNISKAYLDSWREQSFKKLETFSCRDSELMYITKQLKEKLLSDGNSVIHLVDDKLLLSSDKSYYSSSNLERLYHFIFAAVIEYHLSNRTLKNLTRGYLNSIAVYYILYYTDFPDINKSIESPLGECFFTMLYSLK